VSARDFVRRHVFHNLTLKLTSIMLAAGLWLAVASSPLSEVALNVAIIFRNMPPDLEISSQNVPMVQIRVRGPERVVRALQSSDVHAEIDLSGMKPGEHSFDLTKAIGVPDRLEVAQVVPSEVRIQFDTRATRLVPVRPRVVGTFPPGYHLVAVQSDPDRVQIVGPTNEIDAVDAAVTDPVDITGVLDSLTVARPAYVSDPLIQVTNPHPVRITVTVEKDKTASSGNSDSSKPGSSKAGSSKAGSHKSE
jgi:YbbR domain-containing protein